jgi:hypothetical protein
LICNNLPKSRRTVHLDQYYAACIPFVSSLLAFRPDRQKHHHPVASMAILASSCLRVSRPDFFWSWDVFLGMGLGVLRCIQHPPRIPSQLEMRELGTGVILLLSLNVATIMATIYLFIPVRIAGG